MMDHIRKSNDLCSRKPCTVHCHSYVANLLQVRTSNAAVAANSSSPGCMEENLDANSVCASQLSHLQGCYYHIERNISSAGNRTVGVCISPQNSQEQQESVAKNLHDALQVFRAKVPQKCRAHVEPFVCLFLFPLAVLENGLGPTTRSCENIRDDVCAEVWKIAKKLGVEGLPECESLAGNQVDLLQSCEG